MTVPTRQPGANEAEAELRTRIKFCGCTTPNDVATAVECGVDAVGVIFAAASPRYVDADAARHIARVVPPFVALVGVFVEPAAVHVSQARAVGFFPQFSGNESAALCESAADGPYIKVFHIDPDSAPAGLDPAAFARTAEPYTNATWMFDASVAGKHGGTGRAFDWELTRVLAAERRVIISGGLTPENVAACIRRVRPYGVDVRSGIETDGVKDPAKMRAFVRAVKEADAQA